MSALEPIDWRSLPGFEGRYQISEYGDIRNTATGLLRRPFHSSTGYFRCHFSTAGLDQHLDVHRMVALAFIGEPPSDRHNACHNDGIKSNNHYSNLRWDLPSGNMMDKHRHGTMPDGERHYNSSLSDIEVRLIKHLVSNGVRNLEIATRSGISREHVRRIGLGTTRHGAL